MPTSKAHDVQENAGANTSVIGVVHVAKSSVHSESIDNAVKVREILLVRRALIDHGHLPTSVKENTSAVISPFGSMLFGKELRQVLALQFAINNIGEKGRVCLNPQKEMRKNLSGGDCTVSIS